MVKQRPVNEEKAQMLSRDQKTNPDLTIEKGSKRISLQRILKPNRDEKSVRLVVKNEGEPVRNCCVIVEGFEFYYRDDWMMAPNGYERKALKWRVRNEPIKGKLDIAAKKSSQIEITKARRIPNPHFKISYHDVSAGKTHHLLGRYKLRVKIEAITASNAGERNTKTDFYDIYFEYEKTLKIRVTEIMRVAPPDSAT